MITTRSVLLSLSLVLLLLGSILCGAQNRSFDLLELKDNIIHRISASSSEVNFALSSDPVNPGVDVSIQPGKDAYPGVNIKPNGASWNLSDYGCVEATVLNTGSHPLHLSLRVDNAGDWRNNPWDTESVTIAPMASGVVTVYFGYSYGYKPGYKLNPSEVVNLVLFASKTDAPQFFRILSIRATGTAGEKPPLPPDKIHIKPENGVILGNGCGSNIKTQVNAYNAEVSYDDVNGNSSLQIKFPANQPNQSVTFAPVNARWDLRDYLEVTLRIHNDGNTACTPKVKLESNGGSTDWVSSKAPISPGKSGEVVISFLGPPIVIGDQASENRITNDSISGILFSADPPNQTRMLLVGSIIAGLPPEPREPSWLGKRPPVPGDWVKTLDDEFNGDSLDQSIWSVYGPNYWDKESHWSKDDVIVGDGVVRLRYEKKSGYNDDNPKEEKTDYASGYLHTYKKWAQRYGYFESRMKLPTAPGLWPAFWMMPDRGPEYSPRSGRQDTHNGGMEFDVMEHLDRWGPYRYNIAMHWDGYGKDHKSVGSDKIYVQPDKEGYITCGLLWTPGHASFYCNGKEALTWDNARISDVPEDIMFTLPQGGWDNNPIDDSKLPDDFIIDYVRVWQRKDLASAADGKEHRGEK
jgi:beta-glucanase (GH16 family)